jgi:hypothetical protein
MDIAIGLTSTKAKNNMLAVEVSLLLNFIIVDDALLIDAINLSLFMRISPYLHHRQKNATTKNVTIPPMVHLVRTFVVSLPKADSTAPPPREEPMPLLADGLCIRITRVKKILAQTKMKVNRNEENAYILFGKMITALVLARQKLCGFLKQEISYSCAEESVGLLVGVSLSSADITSLVINVLLPDPTPNVLPAKDDCEFLVLTEFTLVFWAAKSSLLGFVSMGRQCCKNHRELQAKFYTQNTCL